MFSQNDPVQLAALKTELTTNPKALGYAPHITSGNHAALAAILNATYPAAGNIQLGDVPCHKVRSCISLADWAAITPEQRTYLHMLLDGETVNLSDGMVDDNLVKAGGIWPPGTTLNSRARIVAMKQKKATRAEELFGLDASIQHPAVSAALQLP
jgi:hypothetical protein